MMRLKTAVLAALLGAMLLLGGVQSGFAQASTNPAESSPIGWGTSRAQDTHAIPEIELLRELSRRRPEATTLAVEAALGQLDLVVVEAGDSLSKIAQERGTTVERLFAKNPQIEFDCLIEPGDLLVIPDPVEELLPRELAPCPLTPAIKSGNGPRGPPVYIAGSDQWARLRQCEAGGNYATRTGNGYYGAYQFDWGTWNGIGVVRAAINADHNGDGLGDHDPNQPIHLEWEDASVAPPWLQDAAAQELQRSRGWGPWPTCAAGW